MSLELCMLLVRYLSILIEVTSVDRLWCRLLIVALVVLLIVQQPSEKQNIKIKPRQFFFLLWIFNIGVTYPKSEARCLHESLCVCCHVFFFSCGGVCVCSLLQSSKASTHWHHSLYKGLSAPWHRLCSGPHHLSVTHVHFAAQLQRVFGARGWVQVLPKAWLMLNALKAALLF